MSIQDRDWYRDDLNRRRALEESAAEAAKRRGTNAPPTFRPANPTPRQKVPAARVPLPLILSGAFIVVAVLRASGFIWDGNLTLPLKVDVMPSTPVADANPFSPVDDVVPFPASGATTLYFSIVPGEAMAPLTLQTAPARAGWRYVITVRDWTTDALIAETYLKANAVETLQLPAGDYRVEFASGRSWSGKASLFGPETVTQRARYPTTLIAYPDHIMGQVIYLMPTAHPNFPTDSQRVPLFRE